jgi:hypothetical protein
MMGCLLSWDMRNSSTEGDSSSFHIIFSYVVASEKYILNQVTMELPQQ